MKTRIWKIRYRTRHGWETRYYSSQSEYSKAFKRLIDEPTLQISYGDIEWHPINGKVTQLIMDLEAHQQELVSTGSNSKAPDT